MPSPIYLGIHNANHTELRHQLFLPSVLQDSLRWAIDPSAEESHAENHLNFKVMITRDVCSVYG